MEIKLRFQIPQSGVVCTGPKTVSDYLLEVFFGGQMDVRQRSNLCISADWKGKKRTKKYPMKLTALCSTSEEAEAKYGKDKIKAYKTSFTNMYHALTHRKTSTMMKLVCLLPEEKVTTY